MVVLLHLVFQGAREREHDNEVERARYVPRWWWWLSFGVWSIRYFVGEISSTCLLSAGLVGWLPSSLPGRSCGCGRGRGASARGVAMHAVFRGAFVH